MNLSMLNVRTVYTILISASLIRGGAAANTLTWSGGANRMWDTASANWIGASAVFSDFDDVVFGETGAGDIQVPESGVTPGVITFDGGGYLFMGGPIKGSGRMSIGNGATVTFRTPPEAREIVLDNTRLVFAPVSDSVFSGYAMTGSGSFMPSRPLTADDTTVTTVENMTLDGDFVVEMSLGADDPNDRRPGRAVFGSGFVATGLRHIYLGIAGPCPADALLTLADGSSVTMAQDAEIQLGQWGVDANNLHRIIIDGGVLDASRAKEPFVGYDTRNAEFLVKAGTAKLPGVATRARNSSNMKPLADEVAYTSPNPGCGYEVFGMSGGTVELGGDFRTERFYPYLPQLWLGGGTLRSMADWKTDFYQYVTFETWGDSRDATRKEFTLDTNGHTVTFRSAQQGNAKVKIVGSGGFIADDGVQGGVSGHWTIENTGEAKLKNAAAFADGLTLGDGVTATIDIGARTNYASLAVGCLADNGAGENAFTKEDFWQAAGVFPSLFVKDFQKLFLLGTTPFNTAFRQEAEFYVDEAGAYTFAVAYDDCGRVVIDGKLVAFNDDCGGVGVGTVQLARGWHRLNVTCMDAAGEAGPRSAGWAGNLAVGWRKGETSSTAAQDYNPIGSRTMKMRPVPTVRWNRRYIGGSVPEDWESNDSYTFSMVTNSMQAIHATDRDSDWQLTREALNSYTGWTYVEPGESGEWQVEGLFDDRLGLQIDGQPVFANSVWNESKAATVAVSPGWHKFKVTVVDCGGGWSWSGKEGYGAALYVKRPCDDVKVPFDERNIRMSAEPYGFIGGALNVGAGATLVNASDTPCEITGTVNGTGALSGRFALTGTWNVTMEDGENLRSVTWTDGIDLSHARLNVDIRGTAPRKTRYDLGPATGLDGLSDRLTVTLDGAECPNLFTVIQRAGRAVLKLNRPFGLIISVR